MVCGKVTLIDRLVVKITLINRLAVKITLIDQLVKKTTIMVGGKDNFNEWSVVKLPSSIIWS